MSGERREHLEAAIAVAANSLEWRRIQAILMLSNGVAAAEVIARLRCGHATLNRWWHIWEAKGLDGLLEQQQMGRPQSINSEMEQLLETLLARCAAPSNRTGLVDKMWTVRSLRLELEKHGIAVCDRTVRRTLKRRGWRYINGCWRRTGDCG